jgi:hypothetical protein
MVSEHRPLTEIERELEQCELLCANCQRKGYHGNLADCGR